MWETFQNPQWYTIGPDWANSVSGHESQEKTGRAHYDVVKNNCDHRLISGNFLFWKD